MQISKAQLLAALAKWHRDWQADPEGYMNAQTDLEQPPEEWADGVWNILGPNLAEQGVEVED